MTGRLLGLQELSSCDALLSIWQRRLLHASSHPRAAAPAGVALLLGITVVVVVVVRRRSLGCLQDQGNTGADGGRGASKPGSAQRLGKHEEGGSEVAEGSGSDNCSAREEGCVGAAAEPQG